MPEQVLINKIAEQVAYNDENADLDRMGPNRRAAQESYSAAFHRITDETIKFDLDEAVGSMLSEEALYYCRIGVAAGFEAAMNALKGVI